MIRYAIESVFPHVDELVIIDSGATDGTIDIAREYTPNIFFNEFEDFSKQRNFALSKCTGDWIFYLDADEVVGENFPQLRKYFNKNYNTLLTPRYYLVGLNPPAFIYNYGYYFDWQQRCVRNTGKAYFIYPVHHQLMDAHPRLKVTNVHIFHLDFLLHSYEQRKKKADYYEAMDPGSSGENYYLFENIPYKTAPIMEQLSPKILEMLRNDPKLLEYPLHPAENELAKLKFRVRSRELLTLTRSFLNI
jgi:glycosyltransferase involved in cell wall biosynthesis